MLESLLDSTNVLISVSSYLRKACFSIAMKRFLKNKLENLKLNESSIVKNS